MNKNLQMVYTYHNQTKHSAQKYAKSLGYMDWETQANPYRSYENTTKTFLPLALQNNTLPYNEIFNENRNVIAPFCKESISQLFQFSLGLSAIKKAGDQSWDLRCNASSGNLQPTEAYIICDGIQNIDNGISHYNVKDHAVELLAKPNDKLSLPHDSFLVCLSSIVWREAWKYGERSWRYTNLDCGHAIRALEISALMLGWKMTTIDTNEDELNNLIGFNQKNRYIKEERENAAVLLLVSKDNNNLNIDIKILRECFDKIYQSRANQLSKSWHKWNILGEIEEACRIKKDNFIIETKLISSIREESYESKVIVLNRRSVKQMNINDSNISFKQFETIISSVSSPFNTKQSAVNLVLFVHNVEGIDSGMYILIRNILHKHPLMAELKDEFLWEEINIKQSKLYLLRRGDYKAISKTISCNQDIASNGAFSIGMLAQFDKQLNTYGAFRYKQLYWECGEIGQQLYLEATSVNLSATGIGCFLDDLFHSVLGIKNSSFQSLYHFTIGRAIFDSRLTTLRPYSKIEIN